MYEIEIEVKRSQYLQENYFVRKLKIKQDTIVHFSRILSSIFEADALEKTQ